LPDPEGEESGSGIVSGEGSGDLPFFARSRFTFSLSSFSLIFLSRRCVDSA
jgi:hypothetical protein